MLDLIKLKNFIVPFCGWGSTDSRLLLLFTTKFPEIPGTYLIELGRMKAESTLEPYSGFVVIMFTYIKNDIVKLARKFEARKILFKNVSRHIRTLVP